MIPCFAGAIGLVASGLIGGLPILSLAALSLASAGIYSAIPPMWGMTTGVISGPVAAAAIGLISCIGNMGGFFGPYVAGLINEFTGNTVSSLLAIGFSLFIAGMLVLVARRSIRRGAADSHSEIAPLMKEAL